MLCKKGKGLWIYGNKILGEAYSHRFVNLCLDNVKMY